MFEKLLRQKKKENSCNTRKYSHTKTKIPDEQKSKIPNEQK